MALPERCREKEREKKEKEREQERKREKTGLSLGIHKLNMNDGSHMQHSDDSAAGQTINVCDLKHSSLKHYQHNMCFSVWLSRWFDNIEAVIWTERLVDVKPLEIVTQNDMYTINPPIENRRQWPMGPGESWASLFTLTLWLCVLLYQCLSTSGGAIRKIWNVLHMRHQ